MVKKYRRIFGLKGGNKNPDISVTPIMGNKFNVFNEVGGYSFGDFTSTQLVKLGFSKPDIKAVLGTGTVNFIRIRKRKPIKKRVIKRKR